MAADHSFFISDFPLGESINQNKSTSEAQIKKEGTEKPISEMQKPSSTEKSAFLNAPESNELKRKLTLRISKNPDESFKNEICKPLNYSIFFSLFFQVK